MQQIYPGVYKINGSLATQSAVRGFKVHDEPTMQIQGKEYREWDPFHSKLGAALSRGLREFPFKEGSSVLYLGAANGVTCSFISDIIGKGSIYAVEFSAQSGRDLITVSQKRTNIYPLISDARFPEKYSEDVGQVDVVFEDVADRDQAGILISNCKLMLKRGGIAMLAIKARSIDSTLPPKQIFSKVITELRDDFDLLEKIDLGQFERDHLFLVLRKK
ncbi:fibrillarin-like rRNA/tRNA 2'-O-methyltransferase [Candidatus Micrarchaeota archaeon]|nr:fibrillarin-like rRNA/tRNA 2'-O-methyltransferase [Candidatus Micrarchaeota archaeon]